MKPSGKTCTACGERYGPDVLFCPVDGIPLGASRSLANSATDLDPYLGLELPGSIKLNTLVGVGSMGRVYRAFQGGVDRDVAVKILHRELTGNPELVTRFHREAKIASRLVHPNVVQVLMTGALPASADARAGGEVFLAMEYLDGISLLSALHAQGEGGALPLARSLHIMLQICDAVGEAHAQGIVHRDLKPENIMLVRRGDDPDVVKVLDFGIARMDRAEEAETTQAGLIFGTAKYISPEGAEGKPVGPAADVYAIATMLYQCLAGRAPFEGDSPMALLVQQIHAPPTDLRSIARASYVPPTLAQVVMGNLAKSADERAENARELGREISLAAREAGIALDTIHVAQKGQLRLASKQRTKQHEFTPELKARIASIPDPSSPAGLTEMVEDVTETGGASAPPAPPPPRVSYPGDAVRSSRPGSSVPPIAASHTEIVDEDDTIQGSLEEHRRVSRPSSSRPGPTIAGEPLETALRPSARPSAPRASSSGRPSAPPTGSVQPSPSDGVLELDGEVAPHATRRRWAIVVAAALVLVPVAAFGASRLLRTNAETAALEDDLSRAESAMQRRAWDTPADDNVRDLTNDALSRSPGDRRVLGLRRTAAEQIVNDALGRKYAGDNPDALHLAKLALELAPELTTAQHLVRELESADAVPTIAPTTELSSPPSASASARPSFHGGLPTPPPKTSASAKASASSGQELPPPPQPDLTPPPPNSARPWL